MSIVRTTRDMIDRTAAAERAAEEMKRAQRIGGDSLVIVNSQTGNDYDVVNALLSGVAMESQWIVTFTPDVASSKPIYAEFGLKWFMNSGGTIYDQENIDFWDDPTTENSTTRRRFIVAFMNSFNDQRISMKFSIKSAQGGVLTWERTK